MSQTLIVSDTLYAQLEATAHARGLSSVEELLQQLIEMGRARIEEFSRRQQAVQRIDALRAQLFAKYGQMADSVELIRADRER
jgi:SOS response regulatory protein OraA/RecX